MISESNYIELMKNCSKWNGRNIAGKTRSTTRVFDQQTGIVQRPTDTLYRSEWERCEPQNPMQVIAYPAKRWKRSADIPSDACEHKYLMRAYPAIRDAINALENPGGGNAPPSGEDTNDSTTVSMSTRNNGAKNYSEYALDSLDFDDLDDTDDNDKDEEEYGSRNRRKKGGSSKRGEGWSNRPRRSAASQPGGTERLPSSVRESPSSGGGGDGEIRPFVCQHCGAKYKSRPGLTYHRLHVHPEMAQQPKKPLSPPTVPDGVEVSDTCDFCNGTKRRNASRQPENLISCHDCGRSAHVSCLKFDHADALTVATERYGWQCIECKSCTICGTSENDDER
ncbi:Protein DPFF-1 a [Aphelenchoides avenae]|nr:Protein DPFF-1 a [Aphelenchus avenae]